MNQLLHTKILSQSRVSKLRLIQVRLTTFLVNQAQKGSQKRSIIEVNCQMSCGKWCVEDRSSLLGSIFEVNKDRRAKKLRLSSKMVIFLRLK